MTPNKKSLSRKSLKKWGALITLFALVTGIHLWLLSIDLYGAHSLKAKLRNQDLNRPTIAALWSNTYSGGSALINKPLPKAEVAENAENSQIKAPSYSKKSPFSFGGTPSATQDQDNYLSSQKLREITIRNEQVSMSASTQTAIRELQGIVFQNSKTTTTGQKNCCTVAAIQSQAICSTPEVSAFYQGIFEALRSRLDNLAREGIKEFCE